MRTINLILLLIVILTNSSFAEVRVAAILKLEDNYSIFPKDILASMKFALSSIESKHKIIFQSFAHDGTPDSIKKSIINAKKFTPHIVIAGETSQFAMVIARAFKDTIFITPTASSIKLAECHPRPIHLTHSDDQYVKIVDHIIKKNNFSNIGLLHNISYPNTEVIGKSIINYLKARNITTHTITSHSGEELNSVKLQDFIAKKIDLLILFSFETDLRNTYTTLKKSNIFPIYIGADSWGSDSRLKENMFKKDNRFHGIRSMYWNSTRSDEFFVKTVAKLEKFTGKKADAFHAIGFDTMKLVIDNLNIIDDLENFNTSLKKNVFKNFLTTNILTFNDSYYPIKDFYLYEIKSGKSKFLEKI